MPATHRPQVVTGVGPCRIPDPPPKRLVAGSALDRRELQAMLDLQPHRPLIGISTRRNNFPPGNGLKLTRLR